MNARENKDRDVIKTIVTVQGHKCNTENVKDNDTPPINDANDDEP